MILRSVLLGAALLAGGCATTGTSNAGTSTESAASTSGATASDFTLRDVEGRNVRLSDYRGKVVMLDFWATWCQPCEAEIPHLQELYTKYKDQGFVVLAISMDGPETIANVGPFARRYNLEFPILLDEETRVTGIYNPKRSAPLSVLVDRSGRIAQTRAGYNVGDEKVIEAEVQRLLAP